MAFKGQQRVATGSAPVPPPSSTDNPMPPTGKVTPAKVAKRTYAKSVGGGGKLANFGGKQARPFGKRLSKRSGR
jgi:hypothetical protein